MTLGTMSFHETHKGVKKELIIPGERGINPRGIRRNISNTQTGKFTSVTN